MEPMTVVNSLKQELNLYIADSLYYANRLKINEQRILQMKEVIHELESRNL